MKNPQPKAWHRPVAWTVLALTVLAALSGCANYQRFEGQGGALVRVSVRYAATGGHASMVPIAPGGHCGPTLRLPMLVPAPTHQGNRTGVTVPAGGQPPDAQSLSRPREAMFGSPPANDTSTAEVRVNPGWWQFALNGGSGYTQCSVMKLEAELTDKRQHWVDLQIDYAARTCRIQVLHLDATGSTPVWVPARQSVRPVTTCKS
jgi:hypothetical protein